MNQLFTDAETLSKTRPTQATELQLQNFYRVIAEEIIEGRWSSDHVEDIMEDVAQISFHDSGYEIAKDLESYNRSASYRIDLDFISFLDDLGSREMEINDENVKRWVKAFNPQPKLNKGERAILAKDLNRELKKGDNIFILNIYQDRATYSVNKDPNSTRGFLIAYERVEDCITSQTA